MKRNLILLLAFLCIFLLACDGGTAESSVNTSEGESVESMESVEESKEQKAPFLDGKKLVVFGDSITALGTWGKSAAEELNMYYFNGAMGGFNSGEGLDRFPAYVAAQNPDFVTILFGMNDLLMTAKNKPQVTTEKFAENLKKLIQMTRDCGAEPILLTNNPVNPDTFYSAQGQDKSLYADVGEPLVWLEVYNDIIRKVASEEDCGLIDMYQACEGVAYTKLLKDGVHLAAAGNDIFRDALVSWFRAHYENNPDAAKVSVEDTYHDVALGESDVSLISFSPEAWYTPNPRLMRFYNRDGALQSWNLNGLWPEGHFALSSPVRISVADGTLHYSIENANVYSSLVLYFDGATPSAFADGQYLTLNPYLGAQIEPGSGDMKPNQKIEGSVSLSSLPIPKSVIHDGKVVISGVKLYVAGNSMQRVTLRELSVSCAG